MATITGGIGDDILIGTLFDDRILAGDGNDLIIGGAGNDILFGQGGDDLYVLSTGFGNDIIGDGINGTNDVVWFTDLTAGDIRLTTNVADQLVVHVRGSTDTATISDHLNGVSIETLQFGDGSTLDLTGALTLTGTGAVDRMFGTALDDLILGKGGNDVLTGDAGSDDIRAGGGHDVVYGDTNILIGTAGGDDVIRGGAGNDRVLAGGGRDRILGGQDDDDLFGLAGKDWLFGGTGIDTLTGGAGNDVLTGGGDDDIFQIEANGSRDRIRDFTSGNDVINFAPAGVVFADLSFTQIKGGNDLLIDAGGVASVVLKNLTLADLDPLQDFSF